VPQHLRWGTIPLTCWGDTYVASQFFLSYHHLPPLSFHSHPPLPFLPKGLAVLSIVSCVLTWPRARPHSTEGSDSLFATFHFLAIAAITKPNITNNFQHFPSPQEQPPSGVLVIVYLYLFWLACRHMQTRVLAQTNEILVTRNTCWKDFSVPYW